MSSDFSAPPQFNAAHATRWCDADAARSYKHRAPYPVEAFDVLSSLIKDEPRTVLDIGCGTGYITRPLAPRVHRIDAVDLAAEMIAEAKTLPGGDANNIRWRIACAEEVALDGPYALAVGGASLHWMDFRTLLPRLATVLSPNGMLCVVSTEDSQDMPWRDELKAIIERHSTAKNYIPFDMIGAWEEAGVFRKEGKHLTAPMTFVQSIENYIDAFHSMSSLTRAHIESRAFDSEVRELVTPQCGNGMVTRQIIARLVWGRPQPV